MWSRISRTSWSRRYGGGRKSESYEVTDSLTKAQQGPGRTKHDRPDARRTQGRRPGRRAGTAGPCALSVASSSVLEPQPRRRAVRRADRGRESAESYSMWSGNDGSASCG